MCGEVQVPEEHLEVLQDSSQTSFIINKYLLMLRLYRCTFAMHFKIAEPIKMKIVLYEPGF